MITRDLALTGFLKFTLDAIDQASDRFGGHRPLHTGVLHAPKQLVAIIFFTPLVALDDSGQDFLDALTRRESSTAFVAFSSAPNFRPIACKTRVDDPVAFIRTEGTMHRSVRFIPAFGIEREASTERRGFLAYRGELRSIFR